MEVRLFRPVVHESAIAAAADALRSGWLGMGPRVAEFEEAFAGYLGAPHTVAVNTGTSALHLALRMLGLKRGAEVITTPMSFVASAEVLLWEGLTPVFADIEPGTGNIDPQCVDALVNERTAAILVVHFGGNPCAMQRLAASAGRHGIPIVEDCAHACGAYFGAQRIGALGNLAAFSFGATKNLTTGDGGMLIARDAEERRRARSLRYLGMTTDVHRRLAGTGKGSHWEYDVPAVGLRYHMNDVAAAIGLAQLPHVDAENARRAAIALRYRELLAGVPGLGLLEHDPGRRSSHYLFSVLAENRAGLAEALQERSIAVSVHYKPLDRYPIFRRAAVPHAEAFYARELSLPMHPSLTDEQVDYVAAMIRKGW